MSSLVLASSSPYRRAMLATAGLQVECRAPDVDESQFMASDPAERAMARARAKADAVPVEDDGIGIAADQVVFVSGPDVLLGKPSDPEDHVSRLRMLMGREHTLHTAWVVYGRGRRLEGVEVSTVTFRTVTDEEIRAYVACGEGSSCAGGYTVEGLGSFLVERIDGDWFNVVGLPLYAIHGALRELGWRFDA